MEPDNQPGTELSPITAIRVETALSRFPVHRLARKGHIDISVREGSKAEKTRWEVDYSTKHGQPGPLAYKLDTLIINRRIEEARRPIPKIIRLGSLKEICRELGMAETGGNTNQIKKSLFQNALAGITAKTTYRQQDGAERTLEAVFTRYSVILTGEKLPDGRKADSVYVVLNDIFMQVINGAMTRPLDYDYLKSLSPAPQRFYELLSYQMYAALKYDRPRAKLTYSDFCAHAPQTRHVEWERVRSQMTKVHRPHRQSGYIASVDFQETTDAGGKPDWVMLYKPGPKALAEFRAFTKRGGPSVLEIEPLQTEGALPLADITDLEIELIERHITPVVAAELVRDHGEEKIRAQMERLDWLLEKKPEKVDDPAAYLVGAIRNDYAAPKGFVSKAEKQRRLEARQAKERAAALERKRERDAAEREKAERQVISAYWESLAPEQQAELDAASRALAGAEALAQEIGPFKRMLERSRRDGFIRQLLLDQGVLPLPVT